MYCALLITTSLRAQDGALDLDWLPRDTLGQEIWTDNIGALVLQPDGKILAGSGQFFTSSGRLNLIRLYPDGTLDTNFNQFPSFYEYFSRPECLAVQPDGHIVFGGGPLAVSQVARISGDGLSLDFYVRLWSRQGDLRVKSVVLQPDGKILAAGVFDGLGADPREGLPLRRNIARFHSVGLLDESFDPGAGPSSEVRCTVLQPDGRILIGGTFAAYNGVERFQVARLNADGSLDTSFVVDWSQIGIANGLTYVNAMVLLPNGRILIGGGSNFAVTQSQVWRLNPDGSFDPTFSPTHLGTPNAAVEIRALLVQPDDRIVIGGQFLTVADVNRRCIARLNADGSLDTTFDPGEGTFAPVEALGLQPDGCLLIAGSQMQSMNGVPRPWIARLHSSFGPPPDRTAPVPDVAELPTMTGQCSVTVAERPTATDDTAGVVYGTTTNPLTYTEQGTYRIDWHYDDGHGNVSVQMQTVIVRDTTPPQISCPTNVSVPCAVDVFVPVTFSVTATDNCDSAPTVVCTPASGSAVSIGTTSITCIARDDAGNETSCSFNVYRAPINFSGFLPPMGGADATGGSFGEPVRTFKTGSVVPVKFTASCGTSPVLAGDHRLQVIKYTNATTYGDPIDATPQGSATSGDQFVLSDGEWVFKLDTKATGMSRGIWLFKAVLSDGSQHTAWIQLK